MRWTDGIKRWTESVETPVTTMTEKTIEQGRMEGKRSRGRPAMRWTDDIKRWTGSVEMPVTTMVNSRDGWKAIMKATAAQFIPTDQEEGNPNTQDLRLNVKCIAQGHECHEKDLNPDSSNQKHQGSSLML